MFKRKKKEVYIEPPKPPNRILKEFKNYRLVVTYYEKYEDISRSNEQKTRILGWNTLLILESKNKNAMEEPFYSSYKRQHSYQSDDVLFQLLEEIYLLDGK